MTAIPLQVCARCGHAFFPHRLACGVCGSRDFDVEQADEGDVEETTLVRRAAGVVHEVPVALATVRIGSDTRIIARVPPGTVPGARVRLGLEDGGPVGG